MDTHQHLTKAYGQVGGGIVAHRNPPPGGILSRHRIVEIPQRHHSLLRDEHPPRHLGRLDDPVSCTDFQHAHVVATGGDRQLVAGRRGRELVVLAFDRADRTQMLFVREYPVPWIVGRYQQQYRFRSVETARGCPYRHQQRRVPAGAYLDLAFAGEGWGEAAANHVPQLRLGSGHNLLHVEYGFFLPFEVKARFPAFGGHLPGFVWHIPLRGPALVLNVGMDQVRGLHGGLGAFQELDIRLE